MKSADRLTPQTWLMVLLLFIAGLLIGYAVGKAHGFVQGVNWKLKVDDVMSPRSSLQESQYFKPGKRDCRLNHLTL